jgi:hypothetical protein
LLDKEGKLCYNNFSGVLKMDNFIKSEKMEFVKCNFCNGKNFQKKFTKNGFSIVKWRDCGLVMTNPRLTFENAKQLYNEDYFNGRGFDKSINYKSDLEKVQSTKAALIDWDISTIKSMILTNSPDFIGKIL